MNDDETLSHDVGWERLARVFDGEGSAADDTVVEAWVADSATRRMLIDSLRAAWTAAAQRAPSGRVTERWTRLQHRIALAEQGTGVLTARTVTAPRLSSRPPRIASWAAAALVLLVLGVGAWHGQGLWRARQSDALGVREISTRDGQRASAILGDGTRVMLSVGSTLRTVGKTSLAESREVWLVGEAYFDVHHDAGHTFVVHTAAGDARDLGTKFDVRAYPGDASVRVTVVEGRVSMHAASDATERADTLSAGDLAALNSTGRTTVTHAVSVNDYIAWTEGRLIFRDVTLRQTLVELARWYAVDVTLTDASVGDRPVSGVFTGEPASAVLDAICHAAGARWARAGRAIVVSPVRS